MIPRFIAFVFMITALAGCQEPPAYPEGILFSFESAREVKQDEGTAPVRQVNSHATHGQYALEATLEGEEPGFGLRAPQPIDISQARKVLVDVYREGPPINIVVRFFDDADARYVVWYYRLTEGANTCEFDVAGINSAINAKQLRRIYVYTEAGSGKITVDNIRTASEPLDLSKSSKPTKEHARKDVPGNILDNGDFELGLSGWESWGEWDGGKYLFGSGQGDDAYSGAASVLVSCQTPGRGGIFTPPLFLPAGNYTLRFFAKGDARGSSHMRWTLDGDEPYKRLVTTPLGIDTTPLTNDWREFRYPVSVAGNAALRLYLFNVGAGSVFFDAISLAPDDAKPSNPAPSSVDIAPQRIAIENGGFTRNGKPFFPLGLYRGKPEALQDSGFNVVVPDRIDADFLRACEQTGILFSPDLSGVVRAHLPAQTPAATKKWINHPLLFGWYMCDEPDHAVWTVPPAELRWASSALKSVDKNHLTWTVVMSWADCNFHQYADAVDVLATDVYPLDDASSLRPVVEVAEKTELLKKAAGHRPVILVTQANRKIHPTATTAMAYLALVHGAKGLFFWEFNEIHGDPVTWPPFVTLSKEIQGISPILTAPESAEKVTCSESRIHTFTRKLGDRLYLISVSDSPEPLTNVKFTLPKPTQGSIKVLFETRDVFASDGSWQENFAPLQRHVYSIPWP